jgi:hypothetical protein
LVLPPANYEKCRPNNRTYDGPETEKINLQCVGHSRANEGTSDSKQKIEGLGAGPGDAW